MEIKKPDRKRLPYARSDTIVEINFSNDVSIYVLKGDRGKNKNIDLYIKYFDKIHNQTKCKIEAPKHIYWVVDLLIKKENDIKNKTKFADFIIKKYKKLTPLKSRDFVSIRDFLIKNKFLNEGNFYMLNKYGYFKVDFLYYLLILCSVNEKNSNKDAHYFKDTLEELKKRGTDNYIKVIKTSTAGGWRKKNEA